MSESSRKAVRFKDVRVEPVPRGKRKPSNTRDQMTNQEFPEQPLKHRRESLGLSPRTPYPYLGVPALTRDRRRMSGPSNPLVDSIPLGSSTRRPAEAGRTIRHKRNLADLSPDSARPERPKRRHLECTPRRRTRDSLEFTRARLIRVPPPRNLEEEEPQRARSPPVSQRKQKESVEHSRCGKVLVEPVESESEKEEASEPIHKVLQDVIKGESPGKGGRPESTGRTPSTVNVTPPSSPPSSSSPPRRRSSPPSAHHQSSVSRSPDRSQLATSPHFRVSSRPPPHPGNLGVAKARGHDEEDGQPLYVMGACVTTDEVSATIFRYSRQGALVTLQAIFGGLEPDTLRKCLNWQNPADLDLLGKRASSLHLAVLNRHLQLARQLVELGSEVNTRTSRGYTPLLILFCLDRFDQWCMELATFLINNGADEIYVKEQMEDYGCQKRVHQYYSSLK